MSKQESTLTEDATSACPMAETRYEHLGKLPIESDMLLSITKNLASPYFCGHFHCICLARAYNG